MTCSCPGCLSCLCGGNFWPPEAILANTTLKGLWVTGNVAGKRVFRWVLRWVLGGKQEGLVAKALETETKTESLQRLRLWKCIYSGNGSNSWVIYRCVECGHVWIREVRECQRVRWVRMQRTRLWKRTFWFENKDSDWGVFRVIYWVIFCGTVEVLFYWVRYFWLIGVIIFHLNWRPRSRTDLGKPNYEQMNRPWNLILLLAPGGGGMRTMW